MSQATESSQGRVADLEQRVVELESQLAASHEAEAASKAREQTLATHNLVLIGLSRSHAIEQGNAAAAIEQITTAAAHTLNTERVGVWVLSDDRSRIRCLDLYERSTNKHTSGMEMKAAEYPQYFRAVEENRTIAADDARNDPRTREFADSYLVPLGITAMLDAPVRVGARLIGIICHEHIPPGADGGKPTNGRTWTLEEQAFAGSMADFIAMALQAAERHKAENAVRDSERRLRQIIDLVPHMVFVKDRRGKLLLVNQAVADVFHTTVEALVGKHLSEVHADADEARQMLEEDREVLEKGRPKFVSECVLTDRNGIKHVVQKAKVPFHVTGTNEPLILGVAVDVTEQKKAEQHQMMMIQELDHRVKNTLAQVLSIAEQTAAGAMSMPEYLTVFNGRVRSLALAHELLAHAHWEGADLRAIVQRTLAPFAPPDSGRVVIEGQSVLLSSKTAPVISMILHELATNAAKHGALSTGHGKVHLQWNARREPSGSDASERELHLTWTETGGPAVTAPAGQRPRGGFGTMLMEQAPSYQLHGQATLTFAPSGLKYDLRVPLGEGVVRSPDQEPRADSRQPTAESRAPKNGRLRVLVVEDDVLVANLLKSMLTQLDCEVLGPASGPDEACRLVRQHDPDAAILDVNLSPGTSAPVARALLMKGRPFTFLTGYSSIKALPDDLRGHRVLAKPVTKEMLADAVREMKTLSTMRK